MLSQCYLIGKESYENQKRFAKLVFDEVQTLVNSGISIKNQMHKLSLTCSCDWKGATFLEGLNGPSAEFFCRYCFCPKSLISDMTSKLVMKLIKKIINKYDCVAV